MPDRYTAAVLVLCLSIALSLARGDGWLLKFIAVCLLIVLPSLGFCLLAAKNKQI